MRGESLARGFVRVPLRFGIQFRQINTLYKNVDHTGSLLTAENMSQPGGDGSDGDGGYTADLIRPIITCMSDTDSRVRYYACESLYNVTKVMDLLSTCPNKYLINTYLLVSELGKMNFFTFVINSKGIWTQCKK